jgi:hypothetical protein
MTGAVGTVVDEAEDEDEDEDVVAASREPLPHAPSTAAATTHAASNRDARPVLIDSPRVRPR